MSNDPAFCPDSSDGVPLHHYRGHKAHLRLTCLDCMLARTYDLEMVISRLQERGVGGPLTGIRAVSYYVREVCPRCAGRRWDTAPAWPEQPSA